MIWILLFQGRGICMQKVGSKHETKKTRNESFNVWVRILTKRRTTQVLINCRQAHQFVQFSHFKFNSRQVFLPTNPFRAIRNTAVLRISFSEQTHLALMTAFRFWKRLQLRSWAKTTLRHSAIFLNEQSTSVQLAPAFHGWWPFWNKVYGVSKLRAQ